MLQEQIQTNYKRQTSRLLINQKLHILLKMANFLALQTQSKFHLEIVVVHGPFGIPLYKNMF